MCLQICTVCTKDFLTLDVKGSGSAGSFEGKHVQKILKSTVATLCNRMESIAILNLPFEIEF